MPRDRGCFIVLEGIDGAGTTTQSQMIDRHLEDRGFASSLTREPTDHPVGMLIREALSGRVADGNSLGKIMLCEESLCLLFAADRIEHSRDIEALRDRNTHVVCDRYILSSIAYQSLDPRVVPERVIEVNRGIAVPDVTFFLEVPVDECLKRLQTRSDSPTVYEKREILHRIVHNYEATRQLYEKHFGPVVHIDGRPRAEVVHDEIIGHLDNYL
ncbi:MAG: dTMP kinase [Candidatus Krumholzibacteria bacterium]|nr:dTMP kinase [Candidatus Krumholzibacteria bacterium]